MVKKVSLNCIRHRDRLINVEVRRICDEGRERLPHFDPHLSVDEDVCPERLHKNDPLELRYELTESDKDDENCYQVAHTGGFIYFQMSQRKHIRI